jgi:hypothetical protein
MKKMTFSVSPRPVSRLAAVFLCLAAAMPFVALNSLQASFLEFSASAYGTYGFVGSTVVAGKTAPVSVGPGCGTPVVGLSKTGTVLTVNVPGIITTGQINTSATSSSNAATATSDVHQINLLGGLITATEVKAVSTTSHNNTGFHVSEAGSAFVGLVVASNPIFALPAPNTTIQLSLANTVIGKVVLNEYKPSSSSTKAQLTVNMIHVYVTTNVTISGVTIKSGTQIIVSHAVSGLSLVSGPGSLDGTAFGTQVSSTIIKSSATAPASVGCLGNALITKTQLGINVTGAPILPNYVVLNTGTIQDTAFGSVTTNQSKAETTSTVQSVNLLNGTVTADVVYAQADASTSPPGTTFNFSQSGYFTNLHVSGHPEINANLTGSATVTLSGIGTLYLHRVIPASNSITVRMIEIKLASGNILGLPTGMDIIVCSASASLHNPAHP